MDWRVFGLLYLTSVIASVGYYYQTKAQRHTDISYLSPLQNLAPAFLVLIAVLFLGESITLVQVLGVAGLVVGSYIMALDGHDILAPMRVLKKPYWVHIILSVFLLAIAAALDKYLLGSVRPVTYLFLTWLFMNFHYIALYWWEFDFVHLTVDFQKGWHWLFLAALFTVASQLVFFEALAMPLVLVSLAFPLKRISALLDVVLGGSLFHENHLPRRLFAALIMLAGVIFLSH